MGFEPLAPSGEALGFQFPLNCGWLCWKKGLWRDCVPASPIPFDVGLLSFFQTCRNHAVVSLFFFFPGKVVAYVAVGLVCLCLWEKVGSGSSFGPTLTQN